MAYVPDVKEMPDSAIELMDGIQLLIIDGLSFNPRHPTHISVAESIEISNRLGSPMTRLTHITHRIDHRRFAEQCEQQNLTLPDHVALAYDGLKISI